MRALTAMVVAALAVAGSARDASACASCNSGDPTLTATGVEKPYKHRVRLTIDQRAGALSQGRGLDQRDVWFLRSSLALSWAPSERVTLALLLPWITSFLQQANRPTETLSGLSDLELSTRVIVFRDRRFAPRHLVWLIGGLKTPTGYRLENADGYPYSDDDQPGTGSWDPFAGLGYGYFGEDVALFTTASYRQTTPNGRGYRRGAIFGADATLQANAFRKVALALTLATTWEEPDTLANGARMSDSGGTTLWAAPSLLVAPTFNLLVRLTGSVPFVAWLEGAQQRGPQITLSFAWDIR
jgi:hypothetical protein